MIGLLVPSINTPSALPICYFYTWRCHKLRRRNASGKNLLWFLISDQIRGDLILSDRSATKESGPFRGVLVWLVGKINQASLCLRFPGKGFDTYSVFTQQIIFTVWRFEERLQFDLVEWTCRSWRSHQYLCSTSLWFSSQRKPPLLVYPKYFQQSPNSITIWDSKKVSIELLWPPNRGIKFSTEDLRLSRLSFWSLFLCTDCSHHERSWESRITGKISQKFSLVTIYQVIPISFYHSNRKTINSLSNRMRRLTSNFLSQHLSPLGHTLKLKILEQYLVEPMRTPSDNKASYPNIQIQN